VARGRGEGEGEEREKGKENGKRKIKRQRRNGEKEKEKGERERERERERAGDIRGGHYGLVSHVRRDVRSDNARGARRKKRDGTAVGFGCRVRKRFRGNRVWIGRIELNDE
jgi:hypothetical protein